ncbi:YDG domain-containing protein [Segnochrobactrum spirostomi]|uniref:YDG domain-containing protein n=1 Tax=Segnochrobactrum spirostomi TaxID=2608987 RepID=UPI001AD810C0|nr:YDG domain-containing protein [Segnochrobactrum spirostomi]
MSVAFVVGFAGPGFAQSLPTGGSVAAGAATIATPSGTSLVVTQTSRNAIINWRAFSVGQGNTVAFQNGSGATLNRVTGNVPSRLDGTITATGSLFLVNPAGVTVGTTGRIATGGSFLASTLDVPDADFMKGGDLTFKGTSTASVVNYGEIGSLGGDVALIARKVENAGTIDAPNGTAALAAGYEVLVRDGDLDGGKFVVKVGGADTEAKTSGKIRAAAAELRANGGNVYALAGNTDGIVAATGTAKTGGRIFLTAGDTGRVDVSQKVVARSASSGGKAKGGAIRVSAKKVAVSGTLDAKGDTDAGGSIVVSGSAITLASSARLDASGTSGGTVLVGGDYQGGKNTATNYLTETVATAKTVDVAAGATIAADGSVGAGGKVVVWSDEHTTFQGTISATGVTAGGDAEVSGKAVLDYRGTADLRSPTGRFGTLLLDPYNLTISSASSTGMSGFNANANDSVLNVGTLTTALSTANVTVTTGSGGSQAGTITVANAVTWSSGSTLTLSAYGSIFVNANIAGAPGSSLVLHADNTGTGTGTVTFGGGITATASGGVSIFYNATSYTAPTSYAANAGTSTTITASMLVNNVSQLQAINTNFAGTYALGRDIDASATATWNSGAGFAPIGDGSSSSFTGTFDGQWHVITGLTINRPTANYVGLFGYVDSSATIRNVGLVGGSVTGNSFVGGLAGISFRGTITQTYNTGSVTGSNTVGGLIGSNRGTLTQAYSTGSVTGSGERVGGLAGISGGSITQAYATGSVTGAGRVGGLVGAGSGTMTQVYATGSVTGSGDGVGGLVGVELSGTITQAYASGSVTGASDVGGLIGSAPDGTVTNSVWDKDTTHQQSSAGGGTGLTTAQARTSAAYTSGGTSWDFTNDWYQTADMRPIGRWEAAQPVNGVGTVTNTHQLVLINTSLSGSYALGLNIDASETAGANAAGIWGTDGFVPIGDSVFPFTGTFDGQSHVISGLVINRPNTNFVGLFGYAGSGAVISKVGLAGGHVNGGTYVGGLIGLNSGTTTQVYATGAVTGSDSVGGLVGHSDGTIAQAYATGAVTGATVLGGLVGYNAGGTIANAYATGAVTGSGAIVGGLIGGNDGTAAEVYASGAVAGSSSVGGLVGSSNSGITNSFWDMETTHQTSGVGQGSSAGITALTTADARTQTPYANASWNFSTDWYQTADMRPIGRWEAAQPDANGIATITNTHQLVLINTNLSGSYALWSDIDASETAGTNAAGIWGTGGFVPVSDNTTTFTGTFDGQGHVINGLTVNRSADYVGLFGHADVGAIIRKVGLVGGSMTGANYVGGLVGLNSGTITDSYTTGAVTGSGMNVGGLAGAMNGSITHAYATGAVSGASNVGGLVGGMIAGSITQAYATGAVASTGDHAGGLVGVLIGGTITQTYATGAVSGASSVGGLVGALNSGTIANSFWNHETNPTLNGVGSGSSAGATGKTTAEMLNAFTFIDAGWDFTSVWGKSTSGANNGYMMLRPISTGLYDDYVQLSGNTSKTYGDANPSLSTVQLSGLGTGNVTLGWDARINQTTAAGSYLYSSGTVITVTDIAGRTAYVDYGTGTLTIGKATLTAALTGTVTKTYDGNATANLVSGNFNLTGVINSDAVTLVTPSTGTYAGANVGTSIPVTASGLSLSGAAAGNYQLAQTTISANVGTITAATLTATLTGPITKVYDGNTTASLVAGNFTLSATIGSDVVTLVTPSTGTYAGANVGSGIPVTATGLSLSGAAAANYQLAQTTISANVGTITAATLTATLTGPITKVYDGNATASLVAGNFTLSTTIGSDAVTLVTPSTGTYAGINVGSGISVTAAGLSLSGAAAGNYQLAQTTVSANVGTITPATLTATLTGPVTKVYDGTTTASLASSNLALSGVINSDAVSVSPSSSTYAGANVGSDIAVTATGLSLSGAAATNYQLAQTTIAANVGAITPAALTITANDAAKIYDGQAFSGGNGVTYAGFVDGENASVLGGTLAYGGTAQGAVNAGTYALTASGQTSANYTIAYQAGSLSVAERAITVAANNQTMTFGGSVPGLTWSVTSGSLVNGDTLSGALAATATSASPAGLYAILQGTLGASANYALTYVPGTLTVTAAPVPPNNGGGALSLAAIATLAATPNRFVETSAANATVVFTTGSTMFTVTGSGDGEGGGSTTQGTSGGTTEESDSGCTGGATSSAACTATPHPENRRVGRFLTFSAATPRPSPTGNGAATVQ